ncbi:unnamed protein product [Linum trigynum]|uniref:GDSL esterase/lipase n=1 Tax=Linum trigynum TaxID=586398 RepID=A0AAV2G9Y8_9ROSI
MKTTPTSCSNEATAWFRLLFLFCLFRVAPCKTEQHRKHTIIRSIFKFGDSFSVTGNALRLSPELSDGLVILDYIAKSLGLKSPSPYMDHMVKSNSKGANFTVADVTALSSETLRKRWNISLSFANATLGVQLQWFRRYLSQTHPKKDHQAEMLKSSLMSIEIGGNDYTLFLLKVESSTHYVHEETIPFSAFIEEARKSLLPVVINKIIDAIKEVVSKGARQVFVHGLYPYGCTPSLLTCLPKVYKNLTYDKLGRLEEVNIREKQ